MATLTKITLAKKADLEQLMVAYFSEIDPSRLTTSGQLMYPYLNAYWEEPTRHAFFIQLEQGPIGFALVNDWVVDSTYQAQYAMAEFYLQPAYRRQGIGSAIAQELFVQFKGKWEVRQAVDHASAIHFWRNCIGGFTRGHYAERVMEVDGQPFCMQHFET